MKKRNKILTMMAFLLLSSCSLSNPNSSSVSSPFSSIGVNSSLSNDDDQRYVSAKRIYDFQYNPRGYDQEILTLSEFPSLVFKRNQNMLGFSIDEKSDFGSLESIYIGDFNNDGYADLGYAQRRGSGSSAIFHRVRIYDYHNDKFIFDNDNQKCSYLDTDVNGYAIIEEISMIGGGGFSLSKLDRAGRFLKGETISFEWYSFDFKLKSIYLEPIDGSYYENGRLRFFLNTPTKLRLRLRGIGSEKLENAILLDQIKVKRNDEFYSFEVSNSTIASLYNINFTFLKTGIVELEVSIDQITTSETIHVVSES